MVVRDYLICIMDAVSRNPRYNYYLKDEFFQFRCECLYCPITETTLVKGTLLVDHKYLELKNIVMLHQNIFQQYSYLIVGVLY